MNHNRLDLTPVFHLIGRHKAVLTWQVALLSRGRQGLQLGGILNDKITGRKARPVRFKDNRPR